jgi:clan AA aspartic protease (TIGR02281 family)
MRNPVASLLVLIAGWLLGWYSHERWGDEPLVPPVTAPSAPLDAGFPGRDLPAVVERRPDSLQQLLFSGELAAAVEHYEALQRQSNESAALQARRQLLAHARSLLERQHYVPAETLLQRMLVAAWRDVDARALLARAFVGLGDRQAAIDQLYQAKGYAADASTQAQLTRRIRILAGAEAKALHERDDPAGLLAFYQHLTQLEPDHAPYFIGLAESQLMLGDTAAALRSLQLVVQDPDHGPRAVAMLAELQQPNAGEEVATAAEPAAEVAGIPLQRRGNHYLVTAQPDTGHSLALLIDTGASMTVITPSALQRHGIRYQDTGRTGLFNTANGRVSAPVYRIDRLTVGDWEVRELDIGALELGRHTDIDGLLGMNFLQHFQFFIDQNRSRLRLSLQ